MKSFKAAKVVLAVLLAGLLLSGVATAATVATEAQISDITTTFQAGGDVSELAGEYMADITSGLIAQGLTGEELQAQVAIALQELTSGLDSGAPNFETAVSQILEAGTTGAVNGVNQSVGADPNLDPASLTSAVTNGAADAVGLIIAAYPNLNIDTLTAAVNRGALAAGVEPPEAFEPAVVTQITFPDTTTVETPPTGDEIASQ